MARLLTLRSNPLLAPAGRTPGFDRTHPAAKQILFSGVPSGLMFSNVLNGKQSALVGGTVAATDGNLGQCVNFPAGDYLSFSGNATTNWLSGTIGVIIRASVISGTQYIFCNNSASAGSSLNLSSGTVQWTMFGVVAESSSITISAGVPYFIAASQNGSTGINYVAVNLVNGSIQTSTSASAAPNAPDGTYVIGVGPSLGGSTAFAGLIAAAMYSSAYMPMPALVDWAKDPWSFWYPRTRDQFRNGLSIISFVPYNPWPQAAPVLAQ